MRVGGSSDPMMSSFLQQFETAEKNIYNALGQLKVAVNEGDQAGVEEAKYAIQKAMQIMSTLANLSETLHNMFMALIRKLEIRN